MVIHQEILELAHSIWEQEGHPEGKDVDHYYLAKQILEEKEAKFQSGREEVIVVKAKSKSPATKRKKTQK